MSWARAAGLVLGTVADRVIPDPHRHHPVAWFGNWATWVERRSYRDDRMAGAVHVAVCLAPLALAGVTAELAGRRRPLLRVATTALAAWAVTGGNSLAREGEVMASHLARGNLPAARVRLGHLCGRLPDELDEPELARAALESVAENAADAVVAPLVWGVVAGAPGLLLHRGINTLDAMVGHHNARYENFGMVAARLDDAACWLPARLTGALACALAGERRGQAWRVMWRDAHDHPSPNGGWCESAWAGALGVQLGGRNVYPGGRVEHRGLLGDGPRPTAEDLGRACVLGRRVQWAAAGLAAGALVLARASVAGKERP
ncbi:MULTISPECIES: cobalamin biosynthesis protein [unclassified Luteococcus]|uniref:cobalamin biosynthesis protein n=1 Tax=unclassified Luteococcus TaxID=2639923 RepID=UPI00313F234A